jgi:cell wall-associated NlpC family hydrolase
LSDKIRKYVLPNLPYLFVFWFFSKIGTAYRIAPGTDFGTKLMGMLDTFPKAFETYWPGFGGIDLLVGLAGAAGMYLLIQSKIRQAKKFRRDAEYGTARFGTKEDIKPFVDPKFQNNVILTGTEFLTMNTRPKIPANARNLNACVIGSSGSGKTRFWLTPQLLQAHSSYVVVDPKGGTLDQCGRFLQREKYRVRVFNSIDFSKSMHYNPLAYIKTESDVLKFVTALIANTKGDGKEGDEFWTKAETLLYCALVSYIVFEGPEEERNMNTLVEMINSMEVREDDETFKNAVDYMFDGLEHRSPQHFAVRQYKKYKLASGVVCSKRLLNQAVGKSLRTHNLKPKKGVQVMRKNEKITALYERLSRDDFGKGNKPYLWEGIYNGGEDTGPSYEIPGEALDDPAFAALMEEATKYIGWPYVWGGSSPSTSFDCSGFVCWVYTASGVHNLPRTTAQGIYNQCAIISPSEAKPGDIIFFTGTYDSPGPVSHVGIYVGDGMMLHCGSPIQYANINSSYWQTHFYAFGRL